MEEAKQKDEKISKGTVVSFVGWNNNNGTFTKDKKYVVIDYDNDEGSSFEDILLEDDDGMLKWEELRFFEVVG